MEIKDINIGLCMETLAPSSGRLAQGTPVTAIPLDKVEEVVIEWGPFPTAERFPMFKEFLRWFTWPTNGLHANQPKSYVEGRDPTQPAFEIQGQKFFGRWRMAGVRERRQQIAPDRYQYFISVSLRAGFLQAFDWAEVLLEESFTSPGNSSSVTAPDAGSPEANTTSANPEEVLMLRLANCDPTKGHAIAKEINAAVTGALVIEGTTYTTGLAFIVAHPLRQSDGSITVTFIVAKGQFTINAFSDNNTSREVSIGYLWAVPKALAQAIITAWDAGAGRSASASYRAEGRLVDIVLTAVVGRANLTTPWRQRNCNEWVRYHFAWGYTEAQVYTDGTPGPESGFLFDHSSAIGSTEDGKIIRSRSDSVNVRGDGLFDVVIIETSFDNVASGDVYTEYPDFSITLWTGTKITRRIDHGYKIGLANLELLKKVYDSATDSVTGEIVPAVGKSVDFRVTRQDDCSFDYIAQVVAQSASIEKTIDSGAAGIREQSWSVKGATAAELATLAGTVQSAIRKRVSARIEAREDELVDGSLQALTVRATEGSKVIGDHTLYAGSNADAVLATDLSGVVLRSMSVNYGDDGSASYSLLVKPLDTYSGSFASAFGANDIYIQVGINQNSVPAMTGTMPVSQSIGHGDNGKYNYVLVSRDVTAVTVDTADTGSGAGGIKTESSAGINTVEASIPQPEASRLVDDEVDVQATEQGKANWRRSKRTMQETEISVVHGSKGESVTEEIHRNAADTDATITGLAAAPTANGQRVVFEAVIDEKKNVTFRKGTHQKVEVEQQLTGGTYFTKETIDKSVGDVTRSGGDLNQWTNVAQGKSILWQARLDPDGSMDWDRVTREAQERSTLSTALTIARLNPNLDKYGYTDTAYYFKGVKLADLVNYDIDTTPSPGADEYGFLESLKWDEQDGTFSGVKVLRVYVGFWALTTGQAAPDQITGATPSGNAKTDYVLKWVVWTDDMTAYYTVSATFQEYWTEDYTKACEFLDIDGGETNGFVTVGGQGPDYRVVSGKGYWFCRKATLIQRSASVSALSAGAVSITP